MKKVLYDYATSFLGTPYRWGGDDPINGVDCSGLVIELLLAAGVLRRGYDAPSKALHKDLVRLGSLPVQTPDFGVCIFFGKSVETITHVGFCLNKFQMIEAGGGDATTTNPQAAAEKNAFVRIRPVSWRSDCVAMVMPKYQSWE